MFQSVYVYTISLGPRMHMHYFQTPLIDYSAHVQCSPGSNDYGAISEERVFTVGSVAGQSICVSVCTYYDHLVEYTEYFDITLTTNSPNATIGDRSGGVTYPAYLEDINGEAEIQCACNV